MAATWRGIFDIFDTDLSEGYIQVYYDGLPFNQSMFNHKLLTRQHIVLNLLYLFSFGENNNFRLAGVTLNAVVRLRIVILACINHLEE